MSSNSIGLPPFVWWMGIVEDRIDPSETGRVRVRILGYHTPSTEDLPTSESVSYTHLTLPTKA